MSLLHLIYTKTAPRRAAPRLSPNRLAHAARINRCTERARRKYGHSGDGARRGILLPLPLQSPLARWLRAYAILWYFSFSLQVFFLFLVLKNTAKMKNIKIKHFSININESRFSFCWRYFGDLICEENNKKKYVCTDQVFCNVCLTATQEVNDEITFGL